MGNNSDRVFPPAMRRAQAERALLFTIEAWDPNCPSHITARFSESEVAEAVALLTQKIVALEADNARLRAALHANAPEATSEA